MKKLFLRVLFLFVACFLGYGHKAQATPAGLTYQGRLVKNNLPVESSSVTLTVKVTSPDANQCVLFEETHTLNMTNSDGIFSIKIGGGARTSNDVGFTLAQVFSNRATALNSLTCLSGATSYTPTLADSRNIYASFNDGTDTVAFSEPYVIQSVPYAIEAERLAGRTASEYLQTTTDTTQTKLNNVMAPSAFTELLALINGTSSQYAKTSSGSFSSDVSLNSHKITGLLTPTAATDAANKSYVDGSVGGKAADTTTLTTLAAGDSGKVLSWSGTQWTAAVPSADSTKLALTGGTMSGSIAMGSNNITGIGYLTQNPGKYFQVGNFDDAGETTMAATLLPAHKGATWYNTTSSELKYWDGTQVKTMSTSFANQAANQVFAGPGSGANSAPSFRSLVEADIPQLTAASKVLNSATSATSSNTASAIVARDTSGNFIASDVSLYKTLFKDTGSNTVTLQAPTTVTTSYVLKLPAATVAGDAGKVLSTDAAGQLSWIVPSTGSLTSVGTTAPIASSGGTTPTISIAKSDASTNGYLAAADFTIFNNKQSTALPSANIWVGNGSGVATAVSASGDVSLVNTGAFTVTGIRGKTVSSTLPTASGQILRYDGTSTYLPAFLSLADIRSTVVPGNTMYPASSCTAAQTMTWSSLTDTMSCTSIAVTDSQITYASQAANKFLASPSGAAGAPTYRTIASADLPVTGAGGAIVNGGNTFGAASSIGNTDAYDLALKTNNTARMTILSGGNVGIGTASPRNPLEVVGAVQLTNAGNVGWTTTLATDSTLNLILSRGLQLGSGNTIYNSASAGSFYNVGYYGHIIANYPVQNANNNGLLYTQQTPWQPTIGATYTSNLLNFSGSVNSTGSGTMRGLYSALSDNSSGTANTLIGLGIDVSGGTNSSATRYAATFIGGNVGIGTTTPTSRLHVGVAPTASANYPLFALGNAAFDGSTAGYFVGSASGTVVGINAASGFAGDLVNYQVAGVSKFKVDASGNITSAGTSTSSGNFAQSGSSTFSTGTGAVSLNGDATIAAGKNLTLASGTGVLSQTYTGTTTASSLTANSVTTAAAQSITANGLTSGSLLNLTSTSTAAAAGNTGLNVAISGANATASIKRTGISSSVTATGTTSTNVGGSFSASGATNNYGLLVPNGNVGIGTTSPSAKFTINNVASTTSALDLTSNSTVIGSSNTALNMNLGAGQVNQTNTGINMITSNIAGSDASITGLNMNLNTRNTVYGINVTATKNWSGSALGGTAAGVYSTVSTDSSVGVSYGGYFDNQAVVGTKAYGIYANSVSGATDAAPLVAAVGGVEKFRVNANGNVGIGTTTPSAYLDISGNNSTTTARFYDQTTGTGKTQVIIRAAAGQSGSGTTASPLQIQDSAGSIVSFYDLGNGMFSAPSFWLGNGANGIWQPTALSVRSDSRIAWAATTNASGTKDTGLSRTAAGILALGNGTQGDYTGTLIVGNVGIGTTTPGQKLEVNGGVTLNTVTAKPACSSTTRGTFWVNQGGTGVKDTVEVCAKDGADAYAWRTLY